MSEDGTTAAPPSNAGETQASGSRLYDASGAPVSRSTGSQGSGAQSGSQANSVGNAAAGQVDQLATFVREQPLSAALAALIIGYLLGKIT